MVRAFALCFPPDVELVLDEGGDVGYIWLEVLVVLAKLDSVQQGTTLSLCFSLVDLAREGLGAGLGHEGRHEVHELAVNLSLPLFLGHQL